MNKYSQIEKDFIKKGYIIKRAEKKYLLNYINNYLKDALVKLAKIKLKNSNKLSFNKIHDFIHHGNINEIRLQLINLINKFPNKSIYFI